MRQLKIGNRSFTNRFFLGTGKFASSEQTRAALDASETELVTVALTRARETIRQAMTFSRPSTATGSR